MSEIRHDPVQKRWVIIASERGHRPQETISLAAPNDDNEDCPFCPGNESHTPGELWRWRANGHADWNVRVVPNRFPALTIEGGLDRSAHGHYDVLKGVGAHEVIIESREHLLETGSLAPTELFGVLTAWRERLKDLRKDTRFRYILIFKNHGWAAGASLSHPHSQIIATPVTPRTVAIELQSAREHFLIKERCLFCDLLRQELGEQERIACIHADYMTVCPYASRFPFEMHLFPRVHRHDFALCSDEDLASLARHLSEVLRRMGTALGNPPFNLMLHTAPNTGASHVRPNYWTTLEADWHWHIEILPRLWRVAGFEWGTGFYINPTRPEDAARFLREVDA